VNNLGRPFKVCLGESKEAIRASKISVLEESLALLEAEFRERSAGGSVEQTAQNRIIVSRAC
jgi:hypothetical protein